MRNSFKEMAKLRGISVSYRFVVTTESTIHSEYVNTVYSDPIELNIIFNENPSIDTLKRVGWVSELGELTPIIAQVPFDTPNLVTENVIDIYPFEELDTRPRRFKISKIKALIEYPDSYYVSLVPLMDNNDTKLDYETTNFNYIDNVDQPDHDSPVNREHSDYKYIDITGKP